MIMWSLLAMFIFSALGGAWFPLEITRWAFSAIGHLMPSAWVMDGFLNILARGLGLTSSSNLKDPRDPSGLSKSGGIRWKSVLDRAASLSRLLI